MCQASAPPAPTPSPTIEKAANQQAALGRDALRLAKDQAGRMEALGRDYLDFAKDQFKVSQQRQKGIDALSNEISTYFMDAAKGDRERYETVFKPIEDAFIQTAQEFDSPERQAEAAGRARADVQSAAATEAASRERQMAAVGIRPDSGRFEGLNRAADLGTVATSVNAQNMARNEVRDRAIDLKKDAINLGQGTKAASSAAAGAALSPTLAANQNWMQTPGIVAPGYAAAQGGLGMAAGTAATGYGTAQRGYQGQAATQSDLFRNQLGIWQTESEMAAKNASGIGEALGTIAGVGTSILTSPTAMAFLSDENAKENREEVPEGESLAAVEGMPVETFDYKPGMGDEGSHVGTMAQDFAAATGKGDGKRINVQDAIGITMGAVKDLSAKVDRIAETIGLGIRAEVA